MFCAPLSKFRLSVLSYGRPIGLVHAKVLFIDDFAIIHNERSRGRGESNAAPVSAFCPKERRPATARILRAHSQTRKVSGLAIPGTLVRHRWRAARSNCFQRERTETR